MSEHKAVEILGSSSTGELTITRDQIIEIPTRKLGEFADLIQAEAARRNLVLTAHENFEDGSMTIRWMPR